MTTYRIIDDSGTTRIVGTIDPDPGTAGGLYNFSASVNNSPVGTSEKASFEPTEGVDRTMTLPPIVVAADSDVLGNVTADLRGLELLPAGELYELAVSLFVTNADGTESLAVGVSSTGEPVDGAVHQGGDWTGNDATIVGTDLTWDAANSAVHSTAGGVFTASVSLHGAPGLS